MRPPFAVQRPTPWGYYYELHCYLCFSISLSFSLFLMPSESGRLYTSSWARDRALRGGSLASSWRGCVGFGTQAPRDPVLVAALAMSSYSGRQTSGSSGLSLSLFLSLSLSLSLRTGPGLDEPLAPRPDPVRHMTAPVSPVVMESTLVHIAGSGPGP